MATSLNAGYSNDINIVQIRTDGASMQRCTDRPIDTNANGTVEKTSIVARTGHAVGTPSAPGGKIRNTITIPAGVARTVIAQKFETDGGVTTDYAVSEFTEGV